VVQRSPSILGSNRGHKRQAVYGWRCSLSHPRDKKCVAVNVAAALATSELNQIMNKPVPNGAYRRKGDKAELRAILWLWEQGCEVFVNAGGDGPIDMIVLSPTGKMTAIDVKTAVKRPSGCYRAGKLTKNQRVQGVRRLVVHEDGFLLDSGRNDTFILQAKHPERL
jgi:hypothetical protein